MSQQTLKTNLTSLERKIKLLLGNHKNLKGELNHLKQENHDLKSTIQQREGQLNDFQNRIKISKIVEDISADQEYSAGLKNKLNEYIKEIDNCIVQLSN